MTYTDPNANSSEKRRSVEYAGTLKACQTEGIDALLPTRDWPTADEIELDLMAYEVRERTRQLIGSSRRRNPTEGAMQLATAAPSGSFASIGYGAGTRRFSDKRELVLERPTFRRALKAARRVHRHRVLLRNFLRLAGVALIALAMALAMGCVAPDDGRVYVDGYGGESGAAADAAAADESRIHADDEFDGDVNRAPGPEIEPIDASSRDSESQTATGGLTGRVHVVAKGDTLMSIARQHYGDGGQWKRIAAANLIESPDHLIIGQELVLPDLGGNATPTTEPAAQTDVTPQGNAVSDAERLMEAGRPSDARRALSRALYTLDGDAEQKALALLAVLNRQLLAVTGPQGDCDLHTVARGETLYGIARDRRVTWQSLMKLNQLSDTRILVGQQLRVLKGRPRLIVNRSAGVLDLWIDDHFLKRYAIGLAEDTPAGRFTIRSKVAGPAFNGVAGGDRTNPLGSRLLDVGNPTANIHGSPETASASSAPGVMMRNPDIEELFDIIIEGTEVEIR